MKLKRWQGLDNVNDPLDVGLTGLTVAKNVDIDRKGQIETRQGYTKLATLPIAAAWSNQSSMLLLTTGEPAQNAEFENEQLVEASLQSNFTDSVDGRVVSSYTATESYEAAKARTGKEYPLPSDFLTYTMYMVSYLQIGSTISSLMITPHVRARTVNPDLVTIPAGMLKVGEVPLGTVVTISVLGDFSDEIEGVLVYQDVIYDVPKNVFCVRYFSPEIGSQTEAYGFYAKTESVVQAGDYLAVEAPKSMLMKMVDGRLTPLAEVEGDHLAAVEVAGSIYYSTDVYTGVVTGVNHRKAGIMVPEYSVQVLSGGELKAGRYLVNATQVSPDGRESGAKGNMLVDVLNDNSKIVVNVDVLSGYTGRVFVSGLNGEACFYVGDGQSVTIFAQEQLLLANYPLDRQYKAPMPIASLMAEHKGVVLAASGNYLYHSDPLDYELFDLVNGVTPFDSDITMLESVDSGFYVSTPNSVKFISGEAPDMWVVSDVHEYGALRGTAQIIDMNVVGEGGVGKGLIFATKKGICLATADGAVRNLTERRLSMNMKGELCSMVDGSRYVLAIQSAGIS